MKYLSILFSLLLIICKEPKNNQTYVQINHEGLNSSSISLDTSSLDTGSILNVIKLEFEKINNHLDEFSKSTEKIFDSSENGEISNYYNNNKLVKKTVTNYGETGKKISEFYYKNGMLIFGYVVTKYYDKPIYAGQVEVVKTEENRYYFWNGSMLRWIDKDKKIVNTNSEEFKEKEKMVKTRLEKYDSY